MPEKKKFWEDRAGRIAGCFDYITYADAMLGGGLPGRAAYKNATDIQNIELDYDEEKAEQFSKLIREADGVTEEPESGKAVGVSTFAQIKDTYFFVTEEALQAAEEYNDDVVKALRERANRTEDPKLKQRYEDFADMGDAAKGNFAQAHMTSPYLTFFTSAFGTGVNCRTFSPDVLKDALGQDQYDAEFDLTHAYANEFRAEYLRQKLEKNWDEAAEKQYLTELRATHAETLRCFEKLSGFYDDPEHMTAVFRGNELSHDIGRGTGGNGDRSLNAVMGWLRGEARAIDNGWGADELTILGAIGQMEAESERIETYGRAGEKEGMEQFKSALSTLKSECWNTRVETSAEKKAVADKVRAFLNAHNSPFAEKVMKNTMEVRRAVDKSLEKIDAAAARDAEADRQHAEAKRSDSVEYLRALEDKAAETGDLRPFVQAYCNLLGKNAEPGPAGRVDNAVEDYIDGLLQRRDNGFIDKVFEQACKLGTEGWIDQMRVVERKAEDIRAGRTGVDAAFEPIRRDYTASMELARRAMVGTPADLQAKGARALQAGLDGILNRYPPEDAQKHIDEYIKGACDGLTPEKRRYFVQAGNSLFNSELKAFGAEQDVTGEHFAKGPEPKATVRRLEQSLLDTSNYWNTFKKMQTVASKQLEELRKLKDYKATARYEKSDDKGFTVFDANKKGKDGKPVELSFLTRRNSTAFMRMYHSLEKVAALGSHATPDEVTRAMRELGEASKGYEKKIKSQLIGGRTDNGKARLNMSKELQQFAKEQGALLQEASNGKLCPNERIVDQGKRAENALKTFKSYVQEREAAAKTAEASRQTELAQNEPKKEAAQAAGV